MLEQDILRFEVAMNDAVRVRVVERIRDRAADTYGFVDRELLLALQLVPETLAFDERRYVEQQAIGGARVEQRQQIGVLQTCCNADLTQKPLDTKYGTEIVIENLERDFAVVTEVACEVDSRHPPGADFTLDGVPVGQRASQSDDRVQAPPRALASQ